MSKGDFYLLEMLFALMLMVLEILTGRFADRFGKILTLKIGFAAFMAGNIAYAVSQSFTGFLCGEALLALGMSLFSGTDEALLFQYNKALGEEDRHNWWWTRCLGVGFASMGVFAVIGAWIGEVDLTYPYLLAIGFSVFALLLCFLMVEPDVCSRADETVTSGTLWQAVQSVLLASPAIRWMAIAPGFVAAINQTYLWMYPEYLRDCQLTVLQSGFVFALFNLTAGASALMLGKIDDNATGIKIYFALILTLSATTFGLIGIVSLWAWLILMPQQLVRSFAGALFSRTINAAIPDTVRATALSVRNAARVLIYVAVMTPWWLGVNSLGRNGMFSINLVMLLIGGGFFWVTCPKETYTKGS